MEANACITGICAVLLQESRPIEYFSEKLCRKIKSGLPMNKNSMCLFKLLIIENTTLFKEILYK